MSSQVKRQRGEAQAGAGIEHRLVGQIHHRRGIGRAVAARQMTKPVLGSHAAQDLAAVVAHGVL